ncbi:hypothetical protein [Arenibaculum pallidiluteum]|uniref:hypothetical protein n=1 Tax=Arenibaculum pallidiluteum TaxID=2812559 RepID=UPI001A965A8D|nr:hypothetical protein [Arenibaculum pallidiluteum]
MIIDAFTFFNELDVLELRLRELHGVVDRFVLVEATRTHAGRPKPLYFADSRSRFAPWADKIRHIVVDDLPADGDAWVRENMQRDAILRGLDGITGDDVILVSDADEIVRAGVVAGLQAERTQVWGFRLALFYLRLNYLNAAGPEAHVVWPVGVRARLLARYSPQKLRDSRFWLQLGENGRLPDHARVFDRAGWHFSFIGDQAHVLNKIRNYAHQENNTPETTAAIDVERALAERRDLFGRDNYLWERIPLGGDLPRSLSERPQDWARHLLLEPEELLALVRRAEADGAPQRAAELRARLVAATTPAAGPGGATPVRAGAGSTSGSVEHHAGHHIERITGLEREGRLTEALEACAEALRRCAALSRADGPMPATLFALGVRLWQAGAFADADRCFRMADALKPCDAATRRNIAMTFGSLANAAMERDPVAAVGLLRTGLAYAPDVAELHAAMAIACQKTNPYDAAVHLLTASRLAPDDAGHADNAWRVLSKLGGELAGDVDFAGLVALGRGPYPAWIGLGNQRRAAGDLAGAEAAFRTALALAPDLPFAASRLACLQAELGRLEEADALFQQAARQPGTRDAAIRLSDSFMRGLLGERVVQARLSVQGAAPAASAGIVVFAGADMGYLRRFGTSFAASLAGSGLPGAHLHLHVVNPDEGLAAEMEAISGRLPGWTLACSTERVDLAPFGAEARTYFACARFQVLPELLARYGRRMLCLDIDLIVQRDPAPLLAVLDEAELAMVESPGADVWNRYWADVILLRPSPRTIETLRVAAAYMRSFLKTGRARWFLDQIALFAALRCRPAGERPGFASLPTSIHRLQMRLMRDGSLVGDEDAYFWSIRASLPSAAAQIASTAFTRYAQGGQP